MLLSDTDKELRPTHLSFNLSFPWFFFFFPPYFVTFSPLSGTNRNSHWIYTQTHTYENTLAHPWSLICNRGLLHLNVFDVAWLCSNEVSDPNPLDGSTWAYRCNQPPQASPSCCTSAFSFCSLPTSQTPYPSPIHPPIIQFIYTFNKHAYVPRHPGNLWRWGLRLSPLVAPWPWLVA